MSCPMQMFLTALVVGAAFAAAPARADGELPLQNPGFEEGSRGWSADLMQRFEGILTIDRETARTGNASLRIEGRTGAENAYLAQGIGDLRGGAVYSLRAWVRGEPGTPPPLAALKIEFYNAAGENTSGHYARQPPLPDDWQQIEVQATAGPDTTRAAVLVRLFGRGRLWFDDVEFVMAQAPPQVTLSPARQVARAGGDRVISLAAHLREAWEGDETPPLSFTVFGPGDTRLQPEVELTRRDARTYLATFTIPQTAPGEYRVEGALEGAEEPAVARVFVPLVDRKPRHLTEKGVILAEGEPFFPIGLYHVGVGDYEALAQRGFNCVQGLATADLEAFGRSLDAARDAGIMVDVPLYEGGRVRENLPVSLQKVERFGAHRALLNWKVIDEPDLRPEVMDEVPGAYNALRAADPDRPILLTIATPQQYAYWANFCDILQVDPYPLPNQPLTLVSDSVARAKKALAPWQNLTAVLQAGWIREPLNQPSFAQARVMVYLALVNGAQGIFWYSFRDPGWRLDETPLWGRFADINRETALLARPIMLGSEPEGIAVEADGEGLQWMARELEGKTYVMLVNPGEAPLRVTITPVGAVTEAACVHGPPAEVEGDKVTLELPGTGAETVILHGEGASEAVTPAEEKPAEETPERRRGRRSRADGE